MKLHNTNIDKEIYFYFLKNGEKRYMYRHKYINSLGKRKEKKKSGFPTEKEAYRSLIDLKASIFNNGTRFIESSNMTVSQLADLLIETKGSTWKPSSRRTYLFSIKHIKRLIGNQNIHNLTPSMYERKFINTLRNEGYAEHTIKTAHSRFIEMINLAIKDEILIRNKYSGVKFIEDRELTNFLEPSELNILLNASKKIGEKTQHLFLLILAYTGMRKGEACFLKWKNINFDDNEITIEGTRHNEEEGTPKTDNSYRTIGVEPFVIDKLKKYQKWCKELKLSYGKTLKQNDCIFIDNRNINGVHHQYINNYLDKIFDYLKNTGVEINTITVHGLRHTHCTILINMNTPPPEIAERLGNTLDMIYRVYAHAFRKAEKKAVSTFSKSLFEA